MAVYQTSCGQDACACSFLFLDMELTKAWLSTAKEYMAVATKPHNELSIAHKMVPCKLASLCEHESRFQQSTTWQLWVGLASMTVSFIIEIFLLDRSSSLSKWIGFGTILMNLAFRLVSTLLLSHLLWFGVVKRHGCCCLLACCCEGKLNILATSMIAAIAGVAGVVQALQVLLSGYALLIVTGLFVAAQSVFLLHLAFHAFMVWKLSNASSSDQSKDETVGAAVGVVGATPPASDPSNWTKETPEVKESAETNV